MKGEREISLFVYQRLKGAKDLGHEPDLGNLADVDLDIQMFPAVTCEEQALASWPG